MVCNNCGQPIEPNASICTNCGSAVQRLYDKAQTGLKVLCFFLPIVGLILYLVKKDETPNAAKSYGIAAIIGFAVGVVAGVILPIIISVVFMASFTAPLIVA